LRDGACRIGLLRAVSGIVDKIDCRAGVGARLLDRIVEPVIDVGRDETAKSLMGVERVKGIEPSS
jgi:hypothetical protein